MAISEHDRQVLRDLENGLLTDKQGLLFPRFWRRSGGFLAAVAGLAIGLLVILAGLTLAGPTGTCIGVAGSLVLMASAWLGINNATPRLRSRRTSGGDDPNQ
jgi:hypothetical protein